MEDFCLVVVLGSGAVGTCTHICARAHVCTCVEVGVTGKYMATSSSDANDLNSGLHAWTASTLIH